MKAKSQYSDEELKNLVDEKKALPDMVLKRYIFDAQHRMSDCERMLVYNYYRNGKNYNPLDKLRFRLSILECWRLIGEMTLEVKLRNLNGKRTYDVDDCDLILRLYETNDYRPMSVPMLHHLCSYINHALHVLNLTNLLIDSIPFDSSEEDY